MPKPLQGKVVTTGVQVTESRVRVEMTYLGFADDMLSLVWATTEQAFGYVAIPAEHLKPRRVFISFEPKIHSTPDPINFAV